MTDQTCGVVAVLDYEIARYRNNYNDPGQPLAALIYARDRITELIAAVEDYDSAVKSVPVGVNLSYEALLLATPRIQAAIDRQAAALAACKGGAS